MADMADGRGQVLSDRLEAARTALEDNARRLAEIRVGLLAAREAAQKGRDEREILHDSAYARLQARLDTLPVIEQAKGIMMARTGCTPDEAFAMLRSASQRANVPVRDLALDLVEKTIRSDGVG
jgi:hypothetical protein